MKTLYDTLGAADKKEETPEEDLSLETGEDFCQAIVKSREYRRSVINRILDQTLPSAIETRILDHAWGQPVKKVEIDDRREQLEKLSPEQLQQRLDNLQELVRKMRTNELNSKPKGDDVISSVH